MGQGFPKLTTFRDRVGSVQERTLPFSRSGKTDETPTRAAREAAPYNTLLPQRPLSRTHPFCGTNRRGGHTTRAPCPSASVVWVYSARFFSPFSVFSSNKANSDQEVCMRNGLFL